MTRTVVGFDYAAHISVEKQRYGFGTQTHLEKKVILEKWYSDLRAYLPEVYAEKMEEYNKEILPLMKDAIMFIDHLEEAYKPTFESITSCDPDEKTFNRLMFQTCQCLDEITAKSHVLDKVRMPSDGLMVA